MSVIFNYTSITGGYALTGISVSGEETVTSIAIPASYKNEDVIQINAGVFNIVKNTKLKNLKYLFIPNTIKKINAEAFGNASATHWPIERIYFEGSAEDWVTIEFKDAYSNPIKTTIDSSSSTKLVKTLYVNSSRNNDDDDDNPFIGTSVKNLTLNPSKTILIKQFAFYYYDNLITVDIKGNVSGIGYRAFRGCSNLKSVSIDPDINATIGAEVFYSCGRAYIGEDGGLIEDTEVFIGENITAMDKIKNAITGEESGEGIFQQSAFGTITFSKKSRLAGKLPLRTFASCGQLETIKNFPSGITTIEEFAFLSTPKLEKLVLPYGVIEIEPYAFYKCGIKEIIIPDSVTIIGHSAFTYCYNLFSVTLSKNVSSLGRVAFYQTYDHDKGPKINVYYEGSEIPNGWEYDWDKYDESGNYINLMTNQPFPRDGLVYTPSLDETFYTITNYDEEQGNMSEIIINDMYNGKPVTQIDAIFNTENIMVQTITLATSSLTGIVSGVFKKGAALKEINVTEEENPYWKSIDGVLYLKESGGGKLSLFCYPRNKQNEDFEISNEVIAMKGDAFYECGLTKINYLGTIAEWVKIDFSNMHSNPIYCTGNLHINGALVEKISFEDTITSIKNYAFINCDSLKEVVFSINIDEIGDYAFYDCDKIEQIVIPKKGEVEIDEVQIGEYAFAECKNLKIFCELEGRPTTWAETWDQNSETYWYREIKPENAGNYWHYNVAEGFKISTNENEMFIDSAFFKVSQDGEMQASKGTFSGTLEISYTPESGKEGMLSGTTTVLVDPEGTGDKIFSINKMYNNINIENLALYSNAVLLEKSNFVGSSSGTSKPQGELVAVLQIENDLTASSYDQSVNGVSLKVSASDNSDVNPVGYLLTDENDSADGIAPIGSWKIGSYRYLNPSDNPGYRLHDIPGIYSYIYEGTYLKKYAKLFICKNAIYEWQSSSTLKQIAKTGHGFQKIYSACTSPFGGIIGSIGDNGSIYPIEVAWSDESLKIGETDLPGPVVALSCGDNSSHKAVVTILGM